MNEYKMNKAKVMVVRTKNKLVLDIKLRSKHKKYTGSIMFVLRLFGLFVEIQ